MLEHKPLDLSQFVTRQSAVFRQDDRIEPELAFTVGTAHVNMWWFASFIRVEVKTLWADAQYGWHLLSPID